MLMTTAQAIVKFLDNQYISFDGKEEKFVKGFFTIFGHGNVLGLGQALAENPYDFQVLQGKNEQGMAHAATAYAKQMKKRSIYACTSSIGPGAANMVTAAGTATVNNIPLLLFPGDVYGSRQPDPVLQQVEQPYDLTISTNDAFKPVTKFWDRITRPEQIMSSLINAMSILTDPKESGAVAICLPQDVQGESYDYPEYFFKKRVHKIHRFIPTMDLIDECIEVIKSGKKPLVICGGGLKYSEAGDTLKAFCKKFNIPFGETQAGKGTIPYDFEYNLGGIGVTGGKASNDIAKIADVVIGIGTRYSDFTTGSKSLFNKDAKFISINLSAFHGKKLDALSLIGDAKATLDILTEKLDAIGYVSKYTNEFKIAKDEWNKEMERLFSIDYSEDLVAEVPNQIDINEYAKVLGTTLTQTKALGIVQDTIAPNSVVVGASGSLPGCMQRVWLPKDENTYHMEYGYSCMGYEVCGALGVKMAEPNREVYSMVGDGSFLMLHSELITAIQQKQKINVLLFDNSGFGCINNLQMGNGIQSFSTEFRYNNNANEEILTIDYATVAKGYGVKTFKATNEEELKEALELSKKEKGCTLIDIKVLPKTMTNGYGAWWNIGTSCVSSSESVLKAHQDKLCSEKNARKY